ncbi:MAG: hypothetical protein OYG32_18190 [Rhodospirillaceae bacterium]|nr:hypothetical protein [Rhodospirillaceae bacterium]
MSREGDEFISLRRFRILDAREKGLALRLETRPSPETGLAYASGCLLDEEYARRVPAEFADSVERKWPKPAKRWKRILSAAAAEGDPGTFEQITGGGQGKGSILANGSRGTGRFGK